MKKISLINIINSSFPSVIMILIIVLSFENVSVSSYGLHWKGILMVSLVAFFPFLWLVQGVVCALTKTNIFLPLILSIFTYIILMVIYLNYSGAIYIPIYFIAWFIGYGMGRSALK